MKLEFFTRYLLSELGYLDDIQLDIKTRDMDERPIIKWLNERYKIEYELLSEMHDQILRGKIWRNVHKFTIRTSPTSSRSWSSRDFDKVLQRVLFEIKQESSPDADYK